MPSRENAASRRRRRANNTEKKKRIAEKEKAKEDAIAKRRPEEKSIDEILAELDKEAKEKEVKPTEEKIQQPKARIFGTLSPHPTKDLLLLFGGELCDGKSTNVYNELLVYHTGKHDWRKWTLPNAPAPRSAHQAVVSVGSDASLFIFGGEFTSPTGNQFYHYNEFWRLPLNVPFAEMAWEKLDSKGGPSPRSGHRMVLLKKKIVVFGGFHFNNKSSPKYFNDVHVFDLETYKWSKVQFPTVHICPDPRSAGQLASCGDGILVCGGYSMARTKGESFAGRQHADIWFLEEKDDGGDGAVVADASGKKACPWAWSKVKSAGVPPNLKSGAAMAGKDDRAYSFGGTEDVEEEDSIESTCFNDLYTVLVGKKPTWHSLESAVPAASSAASAASASAVPPSDKSCPSPRMNANLCVTGNAVYVFGGQIEIGSRSVTLSDLYAMPIGKGGKLGSWNLLHGNEASSGGWAEADSSSSDGSDSEDDDVEVPVARKKKGGPKKGPNPLKARLAATAAPKA
eukprot:m.276946 g.276946  ORF g.276946 m.276946 type:complete len:512 (-) comp19777_c0_seq1:85-1620(-)